MEKALETQTVLNALLRLSQQPDDLIEKLNRSLSIILGTSWLPALPKGGIFLRDEEGAQPNLRLVANHNLGEGVAKSCSKVLFGQCLCGQAAKTGRLQFADCVDERHTTIPEGMVPHGHYSVPLLSNQHVEGVLVLYLESGHVRDPLEEEFLGAVGQTLASLIVNCRTQRDLAESEMRMRGIVQGAGHGIIVLNEEGRIETFNSAAEQIFEWSAPEMLGRPLDRLMPSTKAESHQEYFGDSSEATQDILGMPRHVIGRKKSGDTFPAAITVTKTQLPDQTVHIAFVQDDTAATKARQALIEAQESAQVASEAKSGFLARMSHEIRTPMNGVVGMADLLHRTALTEEQREYVETIQSSSSALLRLINDILDLSRIEAGHFAQEACDFAPGELVQEVIRLLQGQADRAGIQLQSSLPKDLPVQVHGDEGRLRQILVNLVSNGIKFTHRGRVTIRVMRRDPGGPEALTFEVVDTGIGIDSSTVKKIFNPFTQADESVGNPYGGTGLGLAISQQLVSHLGGKISVDSVPGVGSTFTFWLPLPVVQAHAVRQSHAQTQSLELKGRVLLAEDNGVNQLVATRMLEHLGFEVDLACNGREAVELALVNTYDLILMDCQMPRLDGYEATRELRKHNFSAPILALTAHAMKGNETRCFEAGMNAVLTKPVVLRDLAQALDRYLPKVE